jgi:TolB-like protein
MEPSRAGAPDLADAAIEIGEFRLDAAGGVLRRSGTVVPVRAKTFAFLCHLAHNRGRVVSKDELLQAVWPGLFVSEDSLTQCVSELRKVFGAGSDAVLKTVPKRGYLLTPDIPIESTPVSEQVSPTIAILPFRNRGGDIGDDTLIDGIVEEITYGMARFRSITVIARNSAFSFPPTGRPPLRDIGERLNAEFIVDGAVARANGRLRIAVTLIHAASGQQIWGNQYDFAEDDLFSMHNQIAIMIISRLVSNIDQGVQLTATPGKTSLAAFESFVRGLALLRGYGLGVNERAREYFLRAIELDPECAVAHAYVAFADVIIGDYAAAPRHVLEAARDRAQIALNLQPEESRCHRIMGLIRLYLREHEASERYLRRAFDLNPYDADVLAQLGFVIAMRGRSEEGLAWLEKAITLNPYRPFWYDQDLCYALYGAGRYDEMVDILLGSPELGTYHHIWLAAAHAMGGRLDRAADTMMKIRESIGDADLYELARGWTEYEHESDFQNLVEGLRIAEAACRDVHA